MKTAISVFVSLALITVGAYLPAESAEPPELERIILTLPPLGPDVPHDKADFREAFAGLFPIPTIEDSKNPGEQIPEFTKAQWMRHKLHEYAKTTKERYDAKVDNEARRIARPRDNSRLIEE